MYYGLVKYVPEFDIFGYSDIYDLEIIKVGKVSCVNKTIEGEIKNFYLDNLLKKKYNFATYMIYETKFFEDKIDNFYNFRASNKVLDMTLMYNNIEFGGCKKILDKTIKRIDSVNALLDLFSTIEEFKKQHKIDIQYYIVINNLPIKHNKSKKKLLKKLELYNKTVYCKQYLDNLILKTKSEKKDKKKIIKI